jgi:hypothetical protein
MDVVVDEDTIRTRAYFLWETDGRPEGRADEFWHAAEASIAEENLGQSSCARAAEQVGRPSPNRSWESIAAPWRFLASVMWHAFTPRVWRECAS